MAYEFRLPDLGEGLTEGEVAKWLVAEGESVAEDDPLVEVQTDKAAVEIPSPAAGTVLKILVAEGDVAPVGTVLVVIGQEGETPLRPVDEPVPAEPERPPISAVGGSVVRVAATPRVRRLAEELGVELASVRGSGDARRVTEDDVRAAAADPGEGARVQVRGIRRRIVEHLTLSHREIPAVTFVEECDFTDVELGRIVPLALRATAQALQLHPELNARLDGDEIVYLERYDLGLAVQTDDGLVVPVIRRCEAATLDELAEEVEHLAEAARNGTLTPDQLRGSTFTVTSAGKLGGLFVTPLINHPEVGILGIHRIVPRAVVREGEVVVRDIGHVSVTFDHRVVDGARAAAFCLDVIARLEARAE